jgi:hypothetical protein
MCFPSINSNYPLNGQKAVIFEHISTGLIDVKYLYTSYLQKILEGLGKDQQTQINEKELLESFYSNIMVVQYSNIDDLIIQIHSLSYILNTTSIKLVILDSANLTIQENIVSKHNDDDIDEIQPRKTMFEMDNKAKRSLNENDTKKYMNVFHILNNYQNKYNFNIINLCFDADRFPLVSSITYKLNKYPYFNVANENQPNLYHMAFDYEGERIEFIFKLKYEALKDRVNILVPALRTDQFFEDYKPFGILSLEEDRLVNFKAFIYSYTFQNLHLIGEERMEVVEEEKHKEKH